MISRENAYKLLNQSQLWQLSFSQFEAKHNYGHLPFVNLKQTTTVVGLLFPFWTKPQVWLICFS